MIETEIAFALFDKLLAGLGLLREGKKQRTEKTEQALRALYVALTETKAYISDRESGKRRNRRREYQLAQLWQNASIPLRVIDKEFALRCFAKGNYWMEPEAWDKKRIEDTGIAIDAVLNETRGLLVR
jgi:hypothetical protein